MDTESTRYNHVPFLVLFVPSLLISAPAAGALVAHWDFNPTDLFNDTVGPHDPTSSAGVNPDGDRFGIASGAAQFTGDTWGQGQDPCCPTGNASYLQIANSPSLSPATFSISLWFKIEPGTFQENTHMHIIDYQQANPDRGWSVVLNVRTGPDSVGFPVGASNVGTELEITDGSWHHFIGQYDRDRDVAEMFLDGVLIGRQENVGGYDPSPTDAFVIGNVSHSLFSLNHNYVGLLDDIQLHDALLFGPDPAPIPLLPPIALLVLGFALAVVTWRARECRHHGGVQNTPPRRPSGPRGGGTSASGCGG